MNCFKVQLIVVLCLAVTLSLAQYNQQQEAPTHILKQINKHNQDGSYTYGYEAADGSFKIETKYANGEVKGKYGFVDDTGRSREVEYGASRRGFEPAGDGIQVAPPTLRNNNVDDYDQYDDGQYRESHHYNAVQRTPSRYNAVNPVPVNNGPAGSFTIAFGGQNPQQEARQSYQKPQQYNHYQPQQPQQYTAPVAARTPVSVPSSVFRGHPASNINLNTGSYSINYSG